MGERRVEAEVIGPGAPGFLRVKLGQAEVDVPVDRLPDDHRLPNTRFVAVVRGRQLLRVEPAGHAWLEVQRRVRDVLNAHWDPLGVADRVADEYDSYVAELHALLVGDATDGVVSEYLRAVETQRMGQRALPIERRLDVARRLRALRLPPIA